MSPEAWGFFGVAVVQLCGVVITYLKLRKTREKVDDAATAAKEAADWAKPTGNGFADEVRAGLSELKDLVEKTNTLATEARDEIREHKNAHVAASLRSIR